VVSISVDERTFALLRTAAQLLGAPESDVLERALILLIQSVARPPHDPWTPVSIYAEYDGNRVEALFLPATGRITVTTEPVAGRRFKSPSGAARAVVAALNPARTQVQGNGWRFWRLIETDERLEVLRPGPPGAPRGAARPRGEGAPPATGPTATPPPGTPRGP
jgi:hypothetical protein